VPVNDPIDQSAIDQIFNDARTYNGFLDKPVAQSQLKAIWDLMKMGPTSANCLPARIVWVTSDEAKERLASRSADGNADRVRNAPAAVIIGMDMKFYNELPDLFPHTDAKSWFVDDPELARETAFRNSSLQGAYFIIAARALGLDTGPMSGFDADAVDAAFFNGTDVKSNFISTIGYGDPETIFDRSPRPEFDRFNKII